MTRYNVMVTRSARRTLKSLPSHDQKRLYGAIELLSANPRPPLAKKLRNRDGFRVRVGDYRIVNEILDDHILIVVFLIGHRRDVYR